MKKANKVVSDPDIRAEYDFARMKGGVRGKYAGRFKVDDMRPEYDFDYSKTRPNPYAARLRGDVVMVVLATDVAPFFPTSESVNAALRAVIAAADRAPALPPRRRQTKARRPVPG
ncbi:MAG: hypothetical protein JJE39_04930 [Vicinamibacteria bacterium]|nr:hypothetical protein [Vicinamibacteria bacterium]